MSDYERMWDEYSDLWDRDEHFRQFEHLGDEWGSEDWVRHNVESYVVPHISPEARVLEIGPGGGRYTAHVVDRCGALVAVDVSGCMLDRVRRRFAEAPRVTTLKTAGNDLRGVPDGLLDLVFAFNVFVQLRLEDIVSYVREIGRVLRPGGRAALQYAELTNPEGWAFFVENQERWMADPGQRGRFHMLTMSQVDLILDRLGLRVLFNQPVGRDAMVVFERPREEPASRLRATPKSADGLRRDYRHLDRSLDALSADVYNEAPTEHHTAAAHGVVDAMLADLEFRTVLELGCGAAPCLDRLAAIGKETHGVSLGSETCAHPVIRADVQFTNLPAGSFDLVVARHVVEHSPMPLLLLMEMARLSRRYALVVVPDDERRWIDWANHYSVLSRPMWRKLLDRAGWTVLRDEESRFDVDSVEWRFLLEKRTAS